MPDASAQATARSQQLQVDPRTQLLAQKTQLIGELAGAVANEFNNIMMAITSYAELELKKAPVAKRRSLEQVLSNAARAASLIQKLLSFSRTRAPSLEYLHLNSVVTESTELLQQLVGESTELVFTLEPKLPRIKADAAELQELLLSLTIQARSAMPGTGKVSLSTKLLDRDQVAAGANEALAAGKYVMLSVSDSGSDPAVPKTGARSGANGQDLRIKLLVSAMNRIVEEAKGLMRITNERGGTTFKMYFPAEGEGAPGPTENAARNVTTCRTILVVEDDDAVRVPAAEFLKMEGYKVLQAKTGPEAINVALQRHPLDLLITDIVMPTLSGREVAKELLGLYPDIKVLYMSGDAGEASSGGQASHDDVLQKPFRLDKLNEKIRTLLGQSGTVTP